jgi:phosphate/sulfate permease
MDILSLSWESVGKVLTGVGVAYILAPLLLVFRSYLLFKVIEKFLLTSKLNFDIKICESDRWYLNKKYQKKRNIKIPVSGGMTKYELDGEEVTPEEYEHYESGLKLHETRFHLLDAKINARQNLVYWLTSHYKQDGFNNPIPIWRNDAYERLENDNA